MKKRTNSIIEAFLAFSEQHQLFSTKDQILVATSGGLDSMVLTHLFLAVDQPIALAHVNFRLRGEESEKDEAFIRAFAEQHQLELRVHHADTTAFAEVNQQSIQMAARQIRYDWFEALRQAYGYDAIATAHHLNDSMETVLYNWTKGTSIKGLTGIPVRNGQIIRPLLFASRAELETFALAQNIEYRSDASNFETKYARNQIRLEVIPRLKDINQSLEKTFQTTQQYLQDTQALFEWAVHTWRQSVVEEHSDHWIIKTNVLENAPTPSTLLFEWLAPFGFNSDQIKQLWNIHHQSGRIFLSATHQIITGHQHIRMEAIPVQSTPSQFQILASDQALDLGTEVWEFEMLTQRPTTFPHPSDGIVLDYDTLQFPLTVRKWQAGDRFCPLGMAGKHQKVQDFFTHQKLSLSEKASAWIIQSEEKICWVAPYRIDDRFKLTHHTNRYFSLKRTIKEFS